jgi:hypothetical protein
MKNGKILVDGLLVVKIRLANVPEAQSWVEECNCVLPPIPPFPPPPFVPGLQQKVNPVLK